MSVAVPDVLERPREHWASTTPASSARSRRRAHQVPQVPKREALGVLEVVLETTRGRDNDVRLLCEGDLLRHGVHAADDGGDADADAAPECRERVADLVRELTAGRRREVSTRTGQPGSREEEEGAHRVGARTTAKRPCGSSHRWCKMGSANAAVLPDPVCARPMMSRPSRA